MVFTGSVELDLNCDMGRSLNDLRLKPRLAHFQCARLTRYDALS
jgi:hypothetical protein